MKKQLIIAALLIVPLFLQAQVKFGLGIKGGAQGILAQPTTDNTGYLYGAYTYLGYKFIAIKPELIVSTYKRADLEQNASGEPTITEVEFRSIPLLLQLNLGKGFSVEGGAQMNTSLSNNGSKDYMSYIAGFNLHLGKKAHLNFRYTKSANPDDYFYVNSSGTSFANECVSVSLGINLFTLKENVFRKHNE